MHAVVQHAHAAEHGAGDEAVADHLHHRTLQAQARGIGIAAADQGEGKEDAKGHEAHVRHRRIGNQLLHVVLHQGDQADVDHRDQRQQDHQPRPLLAGVGHDRQREADEAVATDLQHDRRQDHRAAGRRLHVRIRKPGVHREHRDLDREPGHEGEEQPHLLRGRKRQRVQVRQLPAAALLVQVDQADQHEDRAQERVQEELDRGVHAARAAPDADDDEHRDQHGLEEHVEQHRVHGREHTHHHAFQDQHGSVVLTDPAVDRSPGADQHQHRGQRGQHDQRCGNPVRTQVVLDVERGNPLAALQELQARSGEVEPGQQQEADQEDHHRRAERHPAGSIRPCVAARQSKQAAQDGEPDQKTEKRPVRHVSVSVSASGG